MAKVFSLASFVAYGNSCLNQVPDMQTAFKSDLKRAIAHAGYPSKDEIGIVDGINDFDFSATLSQVPALVSGYMKKEDRAFDLPAADGKTCPASIKIVSVEEKTKEGTIMLGDNKGGTYKTTIAAHDEVSVKNRRDRFKK
jgi:hypothetical protein